jgi:acyl-CoA thioesterase YciA
MSQTLPLPANPAMRLTAMPADANPYGDIFGGWLLAQMDLAAGLLAARIVRGRAVTVAIDGMTFLSPVAIGDEVSVYAKAAAFGRSSMKIEVEAWRRERHAEEGEIVTFAVFTFVAIDDARRPVAFVHPSASGSELG